MTHPHPQEPAPLSASSIRVDGVHIVALRGEIDHTVRDLAQEALGPPPGDGPVRIVADLSGVTFMDSSGINALISVYRTAAATDGWVRVAGAPEPVLHVMQLVGVDEIIACYPTVDQALEP